MMQSVTLLRGFVLGTFVAIGGCGGGTSDTSSVLVTLGTIPGRTTQVVVSSTLGTKAATNTQVLTPPTSTFAVELPSTQTGHLVLSAVAYDSDDCTQASSMNAVDLPTVRSELDMSLMPRIPRKCGTLDGCAANTVCAATKPQAPTIQGVWILSPKDIWAVGLAATLMHFDGNSWTTVPAPAGVTENLFGVWGNATDNVWAVGAAGRIIYYNGIAWTIVQSSVLQTLYGIWGVSKTDVWAVGNSPTTTTQGTFLHYDGSQWSPIVATGIGTGQLNSVWAASPKFIYACGVAGLLTRFDGTTWDEIDSTVTDNLHSIWGTPGGNTTSTLFATADNGRIVRIRYALDPGWALIPVTGTMSTLYGIHGDGTSVVYAVGSGGAVVRSASPYDSFVAQANKSTATLFGVDLGSNGLLWTGGGITMMANSGFIGYLDQRP